MRQRTVSPISFRQEKRGTTSKWKRSLLPIMMYWRTPPLLPPTFLFLFFLVVSATVGEVDAALETKKPDSALLEVEQLKSKISALGGVRKEINAELWHAYAGPLMSLPPVGSLVVYFPHGLSEQVAASSKMLMLTSLTTQTFPRS